MKTLCVVLTLLFCLSGHRALAQIPNAGFEMWTSGNPDDWSTSNFPPTFVNITQVSGSHSGAWAAQGEVLDFSGFSFPPFLISGSDARGFPVNQQYAALHGWYTFAPVSGDQLFIVVIMTQGDTAVGGGALFTSTTQSTYSEFVVNIMYSSPDVPDTGYIFITVQDTSGSGMPHIGSTFKLDDLAFGPVSSVQESDPVIPAAFELLQNYPNPFNPSTRIRFNVASSEFVDLKVFDLLGREVATLASEKMEPGTYERSFDATGLPTGVYFYRLQAGEFVQTRKLAVLR